MANLSITATEVIPAATGATFETLFSGEAIDIGEGYYLKAADGKAWRAINTSAAAAVLRGICTAAAKAANQQMVGQRTGPVTLGATAAPGVGTPFFVSATAGKFCPVADLGTGAYVTAAFIGIAANEGQLGISASGVAHA